MEKRAKTTLRTGSSGVRPVEPVESVWPVESCSWCSRTGKRANGFNGFTLVEVLISVAILAVGSVLIMQALARGAYALAVAAQRSTAYSFAAAKLADLELSARQGIVPNSAGRFGTGARQCEWRVDASPLDDEPQLALLTLTVGWRQGRYQYESRFSTVQRLPPEAPQ